MIGVDLVSISRFERFYEKYGIKAYKRFLSEKEISLVKSPQTAAGFWATKEATSKALGCGIGEICSFFDIKIYKDKKGKPLIKLSKKLIKDFKIKDLDLSISHEKEYAIAVVKIEAKKRKKSLFFKTF